MLSPGCQSSSSAILCPITLASSLWGLDESVVTSHLPQLGPLTFILVDLATQASTSSLKFSWRSGRVLFSTRNWSVSDWSEAIVGHMPAVKIHISQRFKNKKVSTNN